MDTVAQTVDGVQSVRPTGVFHLTPEKEELWNRVVITSAGGTPVIAEDAESIRQYGEQEFRFQALSEGADVEGLARLILSQFGRPRASVSQVVLDPYFYGEALARRVYRLTTADVIRLTYQTPGSGVVESGFHRIRKVRTRVLSGDRSGDRGGSAATVTLDLEPPENIASWRYSIRGATELDETTVFANTSDADEVLNEALPSGPFDWTPGQRVSAKLWNSMVLNKAWTVYTSLAERDRTPEGVRTALEAENRAVRGGYTGSGTPPGVLSETEIQALVDSYEYRGASGGGRPVRRTRPRGLVCGTAACWVCTPGTRWWAGTCCWRTWARRTFPAGGGWATRSWVS